MKKFKKLFSVLLTLAMVLGMSMTTMAEESAVPNANDAKDVVVSNVEKGATVSAYQIIDASYNTNGFVKYVWSDGRTGTTDVAFDKDGNVVGLTSDYITGLAKNVSNLGRTVTATAGKENTATLNLQAGTWLILVTPPTSDAAKVYNPMVASVYYTESGSNNTMASKPVDAKSNWTLATTNAYAKSTEMGLTKTVDDHEAEVNNDTLNFTLDNMTIPSYSAQYESVKYEVVDTIANGLAYTDDEPVVKVGGAILAKGTEYDLTKEAGANTFKVAFKEAFIKSLAGKTEAERKVVITYSAKVTADAITSNAENTATVTYTSTPGNTTTKTDKEYVFTFEFNGILKKVKEDQTTALPGAEFTLYRDENLTDVFDTYTTTGDGNIKFQGLDADKTYYLKETKAPESYTLNDKVYTISFTNLKYDGDGKLTSYDVMVDGVKAATINYGAAATTFKDVVVNTKLSTLPGTGGIGTTIFTIGGCLIMIIAAALFFASRKKQQH